MFNVSALYEIANEQNIEVLEYSMPVNESMSVMDDSGLCFIGIDPNTEMAVSRSVSTWLTNWGIVLPDPFITAIPILIAGSYMKTVPISGPSAS